jgi:hypothetical protein
VPQERIDRRLVPCLPHRWACRGPLGAVGAGVGCWDAAWQGWRLVRWVRWVGSVGQQPAGVRAPVDGAGWPAPLPAGDPAPAAPRWCRLVRWAWSLLHRVTSMPVVVAGVVVNRRSCAS